jgi:hypothetical protein
MILTVNNNLFKKVFLNQISRISDSAVFKISNTNLSCVCNSADNSIILFTNISIKSTQESVQDITEQKLNIGDVKKLARAFDCITSEEVTFSIKNNNLNYSDSSIQFKYHLLENNIIKEPNINLSKLNDIEFDCSFSLSEKSFSDMLKASTFSADSDKVYLTSENNILKANLTDKKRPNVDSFEVIISNNFNGVQVSDLCLNFEVVRILSTLKVDNLNCKISSNIGVVIFTFENNNIQTKFIVSSLKK